MKIFSALFISLSILISSTHASIAQDNQEYSIKIKNHRFEPEIIEVPAQTKFTLIIENLDSTIEEFESDDLKKEKLVGAGKKITLPINGLKAGEYKFYGDFHQKTAQGKVVVK